MRGGTDKTKPIRGGGGGTSGDDHDHASSSAASTDSHSHLPPRPRPDPPTHASTAVQVTSSDPARVHDGASTSFQHLNDNDGRGQARNRPTNTANSGRRRDAVDNTDVPLVTVTLSRPSQVPSPPSHSPGLPPSEMSTWSSSSSSASASASASALPDDASSSSLAAPSPTHSHLHSPTPSSSSVSSSSSSSASTAPTSLGPPTLHPPSDLPPPPPLAPAPELPHELLDAILRTALLLPPAAPTTHPATHIQTYLLALGDLSTPTYQCAMLRLPHASSMDTAAGLGRTDVLAKRAQLGLPIDPSAYSAVAIDIACELGHVHVLDWFEHHTLPLVRSSIALMSASLRAQVGVLEWWKARDTAAAADHPHSLPSVAGYSAWVASRVGEMRSVRWWAAYAESLRDRAVGDRVLVDVLDASLHAATFFGHVHVLEYWARGWARWVRHLVDPRVDAEWGGGVPAFARLQDAAANAGADADANQGDDRRPTFMVRWWQRLLGQVGDNEYYFRSAHSQARKDLVRGMQWWVHRGVVVREGDEAGGPLVSEAALEHVKQACLRFAPAKVLRRVVREPKQGIFEELDGDGPMVDGPMGEGEEEGDGGDGHVQQQGGRE